jgi:CBS domain-containing protein
MTTLVRDLMHTGLITCSPDATLGEAATLMADHGVTGLIVAEPGGEPLGILSDTDMLVGEWLSGDDASLAAMRALTAGELMSKPVASIEAGEPASQAAARMHAERLHRLVVTEAGQPIGVVARFDLVASMADPHAERDTVASVMSRGIVVCRDDTSLAATARAMTERRSRAVVVVDSQGRLQGVITGYDLLPLIDSDLARETVSSHMKAPLTITPDASLREAADLMLRRHVHRLVVVDPASPDGLPLGVISTSDIIVGMAAPASVWQLPPG